MNRVFEVSKTVLEKSKLLLERRKLLIIVSLLCMIFLYSYLVIKFLTYNAQMYKKPISENSTPIVSNQTTPLITQQPLGYTKNVYAETKWETFVSKEDNFRISYPPQWNFYEIKNKEENLVVLLSAWGDRQVEGTELFDGVRLEMYIYPDGAKSLETWSEEFATYEWYSSEVTRSVTTEKIKGNNFSVMREDCNTQCLVDYLIINNGNLYRFSTFSTGQDSLQFAKIAEDIVGSLQFDPQ